jgi:ABC-type branched-subunit amino acid transport system ATPase component
MFFLTVILRGTTASAASSKVQLVLVHMHMGGSLPGMFNILTGITKADQGQVFFHGTDITHLRTFERCRRGIARSFQLPHPFAGMSVFENLLVGAAGRRKARTPTKSRNNAQK